MVSQDSKGQVERALRQLLRPIVRLLLRTGFSWKEFAELARTVFVEVATDEYGKRGRPANASRVAILTGLSRRDVARQRQLLTTEAPIPSAYMSRGSRVLSGWHQDAEFVDQTGAPLELAFDGSDGSFAALARRYAPDLPVVAMFKELAAAGAVARLPDGRVRALKRSYVPQPMAEDQVRLWGSVLHDVGTTLAHNLTRGDDLPRFERRAVNLRVDSRYLPVFRAFLEREGQAFLERVDDWLTAHEIKGEAAASRTVRLGAGVYHLEDNRPKGASQ